MIACHSGGKETGETSTFTTEERRIIERMSPIPTPVLDETNQWDGNAQAIAFGEVLFSETRFSSAEIACSTCHDPEQGFSDGQQLSEGVGTTGRHSPSLWNVAQQRWFFWDGHCDSLWCQAAGPIEAAGEMNSSRTELAFTLSQHEDLRVLYQEIFGELPDISDWPSIAKPTVDPEDPAGIAWQSMSSEDQQQATQILINIAKSLAAFEGTITTDPVAIDQFVELFKVDEQMALDSLSPSQEEGLRLFIGEGACHFCHSGSLFSDLEFHNVGLGPREWLNDTDVGRYEGISVLQSNPFNAASEWSDAPNGERARRIDRLSQTTEQLGQFKTSSLRNITTSAPYMHGGHFASLEEVIQYYAELPETPTHGHTEDFLQERDWSGEQIESLVAFLRLLSPEE